MNGRRAALVLWVCFWVVFNLSVAFAFVYEHEHDHDGEGGCCSVCAQIAASQDLLRRPAPLDEGTERKAGVVAAVPVSSYSWIYFPTLTTLKVRMNS